MYNPECQLFVAVLFGRFPMDSLRVGQEVLIFDDMKGEINETSWTVEPAHYLVELMSLRLDSLLLTEHAAPLKRGNRLN